MPFMANMLKNEGTRKCLTDSLRRSLVNYCRTGMSKHLSRHIHIWRGAVAYFSSRVLPEPVV